MACFKTKECGLQAVFRQKSALVDVSNLSLTATYAQCLFILLKYWGRAEAKWQSLRASYLVNPLQVIQTYFLKFYL